MRLHLYSALAGLWFLLPGSAARAQAQPPDPSITVSRAEGPATPAASGGGTPTKVIGAPDFVGRLGVNTHIHYTDGGYASVPKVIDAIKYLGISNLRDGVPNPSVAGGGGTHFGKFGAAGFKFDFVVDPGLPLAKTVSMIEDFAMLYPGSVSAIEGPNEVNNWPVTYQGQKGPDAAIAYQNDLYKAVKSSSIIKNVPIYNLTSWPELFAKSDVYNAHTYPPRGEQPDKYVKDVIEKAKHVDLKAPPVITEVGYYTLPGKGLWGGVDAATQAKLTLNLLLDAVEADISKIYLYQLLDAYPDPTSDEMEKHFGLFDIGYQPKPAASAIRNLIATVTAKDRTGSRGEGGTPTFSVSSGDLAVKRLLVDGDGDTATLILWDERTIWNGETNVAVPATPVKVTATSDRELTKIEVFDPTAGEMPVETHDKAQSVTVELAGYPKLIRFRAP